MRVRKRARFSALPEHPHRLDRRPNRAHGDEVPARLPAGAVEPQHPAVRPRQDVGSDRTGDRRLGAEPVLRRLVEQRQGADDDRLELRGLAVIGHIDPLAGLLVLLCSVPKSEPLDMDERARHLQAVAAAGVNADATILVLDPDTRRGIGRPLALVPEALAHRRDRLRYRNEALQFLGFDQQRHAGAYSAASFARDAGFFAQ
jgi:hypothetical protein